MARYVMATRRAGVRTYESAEKVRAQFDQAFAASLAGSVSVVSEKKPKSEMSRMIKVFDADPLAIQALARDLPPGVILEPEILHYHVTHTPADFVGLSDEPEAALASNLGSGNRLDVRVFGEGAPLEGAKVHVFFRGVFGREAELRAPTDGNGFVRFEFGSFWIPSALVAAPAGGFWSMVVRGPAPALDVNCPALPSGADEWWHRVLDSTSSSAGSGIRVGVIDSGLGPHPALAHVRDLGGIIDGAELDGADSGSHGTHVCGIVGARVDPSDPGFRGVAPGVDLASVRVFPPDSGANQADIADAIELLSTGDQPVDLINLSLGSRFASDVERDAIIAAFEMGTLCLCAAGNSAGRVIFPAGFSESVAVSAVGALGWGPPGSMASMRVPQAPDRFGADNLYLANFSCFGPEVECAGPGVGIVSTVPERFGLRAPFASMGGTSMACPAATGALAARLERESAYGGLPRDATRAATARAVLRNNCRDIALDAGYQGRGLPQA